LDGVQSNNTICIFFLYEMTIMCTNVHDAKKQYGTHSILMTKKPIIVDQMFYKIISHNSAMVNFALLIYI
jgi:hypothetical protein